MLRSESGIELRELRIFSAITESQTLTEAANKLGVTQSAVSQALKILEQHLGVALLVRRSSPPILTASGVALKSYTDEILVNMKQMASAVRVASGERLPKLRLGVIDSVANSGVRELLIRLENRADAISLKTGLTASLNREFMDGKIDVLISADIMAQVKGLELYPILRDPFVLVYSASLMNAKTADIHQLARSCPFIRYNRQSGMGNNTDIILRRLHVEVNDRFEFDSTQTLMRFVQAGDGWSLVTGLCLLQHPELLKGVVIQPLDINGSRSLTLKAHAGELGHLPLEIAEHYRSIFTDELLPKLVSIAPWLKDEAMAIDTLPSFLFTY
ncbi:MAG: LysR family transcriptional regulator [Ostreibacterium sp.]